MSSSFTESPFTLRRFGFAALAILLAVALGGCGDAKPSANTLLMGNGAEPAALDPHTVTGIPEHHILSALYEGLVNLNPVTMEPVPGVAESWKVSEDGRVYTFHLRKDAKWSNGDPVTAQDFLYAWRRILTPELGALYAYMLHDMTNARAYNEGEITDFELVGAKALDDYTLEVTLDNPTPYFMTLHTHYTWFPIHRPTIEKFDAFTDRATKWTRPGNVVTNGPFVLSSWEPGRVIKVVKDPTYWDAETVKLDGIWFYPVDDRQTEERMFRAGDLHFTGSVPTHKVPGYLRDQPELIWTNPWLGSYFYRINVEREGLSDARVRRALSCAVDRRSIVENITLGGQLPGEFYVPPGMNGYEPKHYAVHDPDKAKALMAEAGYPGGKGFPVVEILYNTDDDHRKIAEAIQAMWKETLGINVTLMNQDWKVYLDTTNQRNYDIARAGWIGDFIDPINFLECFTTGNGNNRTGYSNPEYDALIGQARVTGNQTERNALYAQAEELLLTDMPIIPIYIYTRTILADPRVKGRAANLLDYISYKSIYIEQPAP